MEDYVIEKLSNLPANMHICLYGAGGFGQHIFHRLAADRPDIHVPFFSDTFKRGRFCGLPIIAPRMLTDDSRDDYDGVLITAGAVSRNAIAGMLCQLGVKKPVWASSNRLQTQVFIENILAGAYYYNAFNIELTGRCNMACRFCGFRHRKNEHMDFTLFKEIVDQIAKQELAQTILLAGGGEPMLYPRLMKAIQYCRRRGLFVNLITNGVLLTSEVHQELNECELNLITVSLHNLSPETFVYREMKIDFGDYFDRILGAVAFHAANRFQMGLQIALMFDREEIGCTTSEAWGLPAVKADTRNASRLLQPLEKRLRRIAAKNNLSYHLTLQDMVAGCRTGAQLAVMGNIKLTFVGLDANISIKRRYLDTPKNWTGTKRLNSIRLKTVSKGSCDTYLQSPQIFYDGTLMPCCTDAIGSEVVLGRLSSQSSITDLLSGSTYRRLIQGFEQNLIVMPTCGLCKGRLVKKAVAEDQ